MICPYCAEQIQDQAILCRFCGAIKSPDGQWAMAARPVGAAPKRKKGQFTIVSTGIFLVLSGLFSFMSITAPVPLFGEMYEGAVAIIYNSVFALLFLGIGVGFITMQNWGYHLFWIGTILYSIDKFMLLGSPETRHAYLAMSGVTDDINVLIDKSMMDQGILLIALTTMLCWWGLAVFVYLRRDLFTSPRSSSV